MTAYLGPAGNLVAFKCPSDEQITREDSVSLSRTLGGVQKAQHGRRAPRAWQVGIGTATPAELGQLLGLLQGLYGPPPWMYVGPWAQVTNLLTPDASMLLPGSWGGGGVLATDPAVLDNGFRVPSSVANASGLTTTMPPVPVIPGVPITGSAWAAGETGYTMQMIFYSATGGQVGTAAKAIAAAVGPPLPRGFVTATPPPGAATVELRFPNAMRIAQPAVTWTPDLAPWSVGGGAPKVVARGLSQAVQLAVRDQSYMRRSSASFVLEEVGNA